MNYLLHCIIIEIFMAIYCYLFGSTAFHVPQKNKKYLAMTVITKTCLYNVITLYLCYIGVIENTYRYGLLNIFCIVVIFAIYKLITGLDYIKIIIGTMLIDTFCGITIFVPYTFIYSVANKDFSFGRNFEADLGIYTIVAMLLIICVGYLMDRYIVRRFLRNFAICKIPFQNLFRIICIIGFVWTMYTYSVQERSSITWLYVAVQIILALGLLYITSWFYRWRKDRRIRMENEQLNYENKVMKEYCETLEKQMETMEQFQNDIVKQMEEVEEIAKEAGDDEEIKQYAEELKKTYEAIHQQLKGN